MSKFAETLNDLLIENNLNIASFSKCINISSTTLYDLKTYYPSLKTALKIVDYFKTSLDYFEKRTDVFEYHYNPDYKIDFWGNMQKFQKSTPAYIICQSINISEPTYYKWKKGSLPTYQTLVDLANFFDCSIDELIGRK